MTKQIKVKDNQDIQAINRVVTKYPFDIWIHGKSGMVDAKSLLGMFLLSLSEPLCLVIEDDEDPHEVKRLEEELAEFLEFEAEI